MYNLPPDARRKTTTQTPPYITRLEDAVPRIYYKKAAYHKQRLIDLTAERDAKSEEFQTQEDAIIKTMLSEEIMRLEQKMQDSRNILEEYDLDLWNKELNRLEIKGRKLDQEISNLKDERDIVHSRMRELLKLIHEPYEIAP
jgi:chromosome segregation ATPase